MEYASHVADRDLRKDIQFQTRGQLAFDERSNRWQVVTEAGAFSARLRDIFWLFVGSKYTNHHRSKFCRCGLSHRELA